MTEPATRRSPPGCGRRADLRRPAVTDPLAQHQLAVGPGYTVPAGRRAAVRWGRDLVNDLIYVGLTIVVFVLLALLVRGAERL